MACYRPIKISDSDFPQKEVFVPCGHCEGCAQDRRNASYIRLSAEADKCHSRNGFVLFGDMTYAPEHLPFKFGRVCFDKTHVQAFLHRLQMRVNRYKPAKLLGAQYCLSYTVNCDYGSVNNVPHYHFMMYIFQPVDKSLVAVDNYFIQQFADYLIDCIGYDSKHEGSTWGKYEYYSEDGVLLDPEFVDVRKIKNKHKIFVNYGYSYACRPIDKETGQFDSKVTSRYCGKYVGKEEGTKSSVHFIDLVKAFESRYKPSCVPNHIRERGQAAYDAEFARRSQAWENGIKEAYWRFRRRYMPFQMFSQGVGDNIDFTFDEILTKRQYELDGYSYAIPKYYSDKVKRQELKKFKDDALTNNQRYVYCHLNEQNSITFPHFILTDYENERIYHFASLRDVPDNIDPSTLEFVDPQLRPKILPRKKPHPYKLCTVKFNECRKEWSHLGLSFEFSHNNPERYNWLQLSSSLLPPRSRLRFAKFDLWLSQLQRNFEQRIAHLPHKGDCQRLINCALQLWPSDTPTYKNTLASFNLIKEAEVLAAKYRSDVRVTSRLKRAEEKKQKMIAKCRFSNPNYKPNPYQLN